MKQKHFTLFMIALIALTGIPGLYSSLLDGAPSATSAAFGLAMVFAGATLVGILRLHGVLEEIRDSLDRNRP